MAEASFQISEELLTRGAEVSLLSIQTRIPSKSPEIVDCVQAMMALLELHQWSQDCRYLVVARYLLAHQLRLRFLLPADPGKFETVELKNLNSIIQSWSRNHDPCGRILRPGQKIAGVEMTL